MHAHHVPGRRSNGIANYRTASTAAGHYHTRFTHCRTCHAEVIDWLGPGVDEANMTSLL